MKLFNIIATSVLGAAMAIGTGIALNNHKEAQVAKADGTAILYNAIESGQKYYITATANDVEYVLKTGSFNGGGSGAYTEIYDPTGLNESDAWTFTGSGTSWAISCVVSTNTYYLGVIATNNGVACNSTNSITWTLAQGSSTAYAKLSAVDSKSATRFLSLYADTPNFRCYTGTNGVQDIKLYKYTAPSKTLSSIAVTTPATKLSYQEGDALDLSGLVVSATWSDSSVTDVTASAVFSPAAGALLYPSDTTVSVTYGGKSTSFAITVAAKDHEANDMYLTADILGYTTSYGNDDALLDSGFAIGRVDTMKSIVGACIQLKASTGKIFNKSKTNKTISKMYLMADADNANDPSNWAVYGSADQAGSTATSLNITTVDATNRVYSVDFSGGSYYYFTVGKTGSYATYFDMIVIEFAHTSDDMAAVREAADSMDTILTAACANPGSITDDQWNQLAELYNGLTASQKAIFNATVLNEAPCNSSDANNASVQGTKLQKVVARIEYIINTYDKVNFTDRVISSSSYALHKTAVVNNTVLIIVVASSIVVISAVGLYFVIRKKRFSK